MRKTSSLAYAATSVLLAAVLVLTGCKTTQMASMPGMGWLAGKKEKTPTPSEIAQSTPTPPPVATAGTPASPASPASPQYPLTGSPNDGYQTGPYNTGGGIQQASTASSQPWPAQPQTAAAPEVQNGYYPVQGQPGTIQPNYDRTADLRNSQSPGDPSYWGNQAQPTQPSAGQPIESGYGPTVGTAPAGGYPAQPQYPPTQPQYPAAQPQYPQYPPATSSGAYPAVDNDRASPYGGGALPAEPAAYPNSNYPAPPNAYPVNAPAYPSSTPAYPTSPSASNQPISGEINPPAEPAPPVNYRTAGALSQTGSDWRPGSTGSYSGYVAPSSGVQTATYNEPVSATR